MQKKFFYGVENGRLLYFYLFYLKVSPLKTADSFRTPRTHCGPNERTEFIQRDAISFLLLL
jgi:hypothetical protein